MATGLALLQPSDVEEYEQKRELGRGSYGRVFEGKYGASRVAVKKWLNLEDFREQVGEINFVANLVQHPNLVACLGYYTKPTNVKGQNEYYLVMELMHCNLDKAITDKTVQPVHAMLCVALALAHMKKHGRIHRDIKPGNILVQILVGDSPNVKLTDFGTAKLDGPNQQHTMRGTRTFIAPDKYATADSDVYSFGMTGLQFFRRFRLNEDFKQLMLKCVLNDADKRPKIETVCKQLKAMENSVCETLSELEVEKIEQDLDTMCKDPNKYFKPKKHCERPAISFLLGGLTRHDLHNLVKEVDPAIDSDTVNALTKTQLIGTLLSDSPQHLNKILKAVDDSDIRACLLRNGIKSVGATTHLRTYFKDHQSRVEKSATPSDADNKDPIMGELDNDQKAMQSFLTAFDKNELLSILEDCGVHEEEIRTMIQSRAQSFGYLLRRKSVPARKILDWLEVERCIKNFRPDQVPDAKTVELVERLKHETRRATQPNQETTMQNRLSDESGTLNTGLVEVGTMQSQTSLTSDVASIMQSQNEGMAAVSGNGVGSSGEENGVDPNTMSSQDETKNSNEGPLKKQKKTKADTASSEAKANKSSSQGTLTAPKLQTAEDQKPVIKKRTPKPSTPTKEMPTEAKNKKKDNSKKQNTTNTDNTPSQDE